MQRFGCAVVGSFTNNRDVAKRQVNKLWWNESAFGTSILTLSFPEGIFVVYCKDCPILQRFPPGMTVYTTTHLRMLHIIK